MTDSISRQAVLDALNNIEIPRNASWYQYYQQALTAVEKLPPAQPEPSQVAKDIARIVENGQDMRVIAQPEPYTDALKAEIKRMKRSFTICINSDYYTGYMSALSAVEGYIAQMEVTT